MARTTMLAAPFPALVVASCAALAWTGAFAGPRGASRAWAAESSAATAAATVAPGEARLRAALAAGVGLGSGVVSLLAVSPRAALLLAVSPPVVPPHVVSPRAVPTGGAVSLLAAESPGRDTWSLARDAAAAHASGDRTALAARAAELADASAARPDDAALAACAAAAAVLLADLDAGAGAGAEPSPHRDDAFTWAMLEAGLAALAAARTEVAALYTELARLGAATVPEVALQRTVLDGKVGEALFDFERAGRGADGLLALLASGLDPELHAITHANAANLYFASGRFESAVASWEAALAVARDDYGAALLALPDRCNYWRLCEDHAAQLADAEAFLVALDGYRLPEDDARRFVGHYQRGCALYRLGDLDAAGAAFAAARDIARALPDQEANAAAAEDGLALVALARGDLAAARALVDGALAVERRLGNTLFLLDTLQTHAQLARREGDLALVRAACDEAAALLEREGLRALGPANASALRSRYAHWSRIEQDLVAAWSAERVEAAHARERAGGDADDGIARADFVAEGLAAAMRWSGRSVADARGLARGPAAGDGSAAALVADLQATLGAGDVLVHFAEREAGLAAYVVTARTLAWVDLGALAKVRDLVARFQREVLVAATRRSPREVAELGHALHLAVLEPVLAPVLAPGPAGAAQEPHTLVVVPSDALASLPFDALVVAPPADDVASFDDVAFAVRRWRIATLPSARLLPDLRGRAPAEPTGRVLLIGDPEFAPLRGELPAALPWTRHELLGIALARLAAPAAAVPPSSSAAAAPPAPPATPAARHTFDTSVVGHQGAIAFDDGAGLALYLGAAATPRRIADAEGRLDVLQAATHTAPNTSEPWSVGLLLAPDADGDAVLDLDDIRGLRCRPELVVLSACSSGTGPVVRGDGVQSLAAAFFALGSRDVVASIAPVDDAEACQFSNAFHAELARGLAPAAALRAAKLAHLVSASASAASSAPQSEPSSADGASASEPADVVGEPRLGLGTVEAASAAPLPRGHPRRWASFVHYGG